tara:strand:+ start:759 stop:2147 length:1389 start_codon:yes stop_codon:yes gene_type:complete
MATIPINRWTELIDDTEYRIYNKSSPHYYQDKTGNLHSIDMFHSQSKSNSNIGGFQLYEKNIHSVGIRSGSNNTTKYIGIRPDETQQDGSQQMEWSIESIKINGNSITPNLSEYSTDGVVKNLGNIAVQSTRKFTRQMVHYTGSIDNFEIGYKLHLTNLHISNSKSGDLYQADNDSRFYILDENNDSKYIINLPSLLDSNFSRVSNETSHSLKDNGDGTYDYIKYSSGSISSSVNYIDAETIYSTAASDGDIFVINQTTWNNAHDATLGSVDNSSDTANAVARGYEFFFSDRFDIYRTFLYFDTSAVQSKICTAGTINIWIDNDSYSGVQKSDDFYIMKGTQGSSMSTSDYQSFDRNTLYTAQVSTVTDDDYESNNLNSNGISDVTSADLKVCLQSQRDYTDFSPGAVPSEQRWYGPGALYMSDYTGTSRDPYLSLTVRDLGDGNISLKSGQAQLKNGIFKL